MNNIDILEELKPKKIDLITLIRAFKKEGIDDFIVIRKEKFETLIAENKELKEERDSLKKEVIHWKGEYHLEKEKNKELEKFIKEGITIEPNNPYKNFQLNYLRENFIPKSKVQGLIDEINKAYEDSKDEYGESEYYYPDYTIEKLQSLLGKE